MTSEYLEVHGFPQCIGAIDGTHIAIAEPSEHYADVINRKGYISLNAQLVCDYKCCFQNVVVKWPDSVHGAEIFLNSSINGLLRNRIIQSCEKILVEGKDPAPVFLSGDPPSRQLHVQS